MKKGNSFGPIKVAINFKVLFNIKIKLSQCRDNCLLSLFNLFYKKCNLYIQQLEYSS